VSWREENSVDVI